MSSAALEGVEVDAPHLCSNMQSLVVVRPCRSPTLLASAVRDLSAAANVAGVVVITTDPELSAAAAREGATVLPMEDPAAGEGANLSGSWGLAERFLRLAHEEFAWPAPSARERLLAYADLSASGASATGASAAGVQRALARFDATERRLADRSGNPAPPMVLFSVSGVELAEDGRIYMLRASTLLDGGPAGDCRGSALLVPLLPAVEDARPLPGELSAVRLLVLDFDGVLTDNRVSVSEDGRESVVCHRGDGWGIARLREAGMEVMVLSTETNGVVAARSRKLSISCIHGCGDKLAALQGVAEERGLSAAEIAFVGNDVNDLSCLRWVGAPIVVVDAEREALAVARWVTSRRGGYGAVREVADWFLAERAASVGAADPVGAGAGAEALT
jgi:N-acylneuraminate cytidylyltransferase